ncbi:UMP kinase [Vallitalea pronyensis]|uniref:Uridylate kinase n=1 Tax=Vallitalea pronyensis TaxID=1348613 RepID=A0A8J8MKT8_9FIRM|nr:UMP kinase [Vallitalea pronyensis]QUI23257.1 UMP kinase [Vallitalea pronyensis]
MTKYKRILLKLSGEALSGDKGTGFDEETVLKVAEQIKHIVDQGAEVEIVIGGGNFWRGRSSQNMDRTKSDQIGVMATVMNALYMAEILRTIGMKAVVQTPFKVGNVTEEFSKDRALEHLSNNTVVFFAGGTGHPYFSTDTAAALRAIETECDIILLAKNIDGVYDSDPKTNKNASKFDTLTLTEVVEKRLQVMDLTASIMCMEQELPLLVFALSEKDSIKNAMQDKINGTFITI